MPSLWERFASSDDSGACANFKVSGPLVKNRALVHVEEEGSRTHGLEAANEQETA